LLIPLRPDCQTNAVWYWANTVDQARMSSLLSSDASCVFIKAGYWEAGKKGLVFRQTKMNGFKPAVPVRPSVHLVFPFTVSRGEDLDKLIFSLPSAIERSIRSFRSAGFPVAGIQFDVEGEVTAGEYLGLIRGAERALRGLQLSACFFPSMLKTCASAALLKELDFICVMFYDLSYDSADYRMTDADWINETSAELGALGKPFFAGIPVYSCITVFDAAGRLIHRRIDLPNFSVFSSDRVSLLEPGTNGLRRYRVAKAFSYKYLSFKPGMLLYLYDPGAEEVGSLLARISVKSSFFRGFSFFSCPVKERFAFSFADLLTLLSLRSPGY